MQLDLRQAIIQRMQGKTTEELAQVIEDSVGHDERMLPGLGVLFEIIWQNSQQNARDQMVNTLSNHLSS
mgnify:CR=1 FL=1